MNELRKCQLCPRNCKIDRYKSKGFCGATSKIRLAHYSLHLWEEPIISGKNGSGTVFFSHCNLKCIFCQNRKISEEGYGKEITIKKLAQIFLKLKEMGAHNINLVTPTHYVPQIKKAILSVKSQNFSIPFIYNTSSYENVSTLESLEGLIDIYLADLKYFSDNLAYQYSNCKNYFSIATKAIEEMVRQVPTIKIKNNLMTKGVIVRILVLPGHLEDAKKILNYLYQKYQNKIIISIMNQYTPMKKSLTFPNLNRTLTEEEYNEIINYACDLGITNAFIQEGKTQEESFIPVFDCNKF